MCIVRTSNRIAEHILIHAPLYETGGLETHICNLLSLLNRFRVRTTIAARVVVKNSPVWECARANHCRLLTTPLGRFPKWSGLSGKLAALTWPVVLRKEQFDMLYALQLSPLCLQLATGVCRDARFVWNFFGVPKPFGYTEKMLCFFLQKRPFDAVITESVSQAEVLSKRYGVRSPISVVPHICNVQLEQPKPKIPVAGHVIRLAFLGRHCRYKGIFFLLQVVKLLKCGPFRLDFYGHGPDVEALRSEARQQGLDATVKIHGTYSGPDDLKSILSETDLVLLPSEIEGLPLVLLEAMAHGVPFVASNVGAIPELAIDNPDVRVVPLERRTFLMAIEEMVACIRTGTVSPLRLQQFFENRFSRAILEKQWLSILSKPGHS